MKNLVLIIALVSSSYALANSIPIRSVPYMTEAQGSSQGFRAQNRIALSEAKKNLHKKAVATCSDLAGVETNVRVKNSRFSTSRKVGIPLVTAKVFGTFECLVPNFPKPQGNVSKEKLDLCKNVFYSLLSFDELDLLLSFEDLDARPMNMADIEDHCRDSLLRNDGDLLAVCLMNAVPLDPSLDRSVHLKQCSFIVQREGTFDPYLEELRSSEILAPQAFRKVFWKK